MSNVVQMEKVIKEKAERKFISFTGRRAEEVGKFWKVEILEGKKRGALSEINYAVKVTSTLNGQSLTFPKADIEDNNQSKRIVRRLSSFGSIRNNYLKEIADSVNKALYEQAEKIIHVGDINTVWLNNIVSGVEAERYYKTFIDFFRTKPDLFPTRSSNKYDHDDSFGVILDHYDKSESGQYPVGMRTGALQTLFEVTSDIEYRKLLETFIKMGVMQGKLRFKDIEEEEDGEVLLDNYGNLEIKSIKVKSKAQRLDKRVTMNTKGKEANVFIFNIDLKRGE
jgi:hypothetical protein